MKKFHPQLFILFLLSNFVAAQSPVQTLRGTITDAASTRPLIGATVVLLGTNPQIGATTTEQGVYMFEKLPVGRYRVQVSYLGYETLTIAEVIVGTGHQTVLDIQIRQQSETLQEVVVKAQARSGADIHPVSVYTMTVEEQFRFPATFNDPARLAMSYPGVTGGNDGTNIISVRGNSPNAVKWRLEGVEIVNPNHTANAGTFSDRPTQAGGGVNILSSQLLGTSNFLAGAFPAGYGNSLGGVFDMNLRPGNNQQHQFTAQAGFIGIDVAAEGPLPLTPKGEPPRSGSADISPSGSPLGVRGEAERPSYLANYRYSFTGLLTAMGADFGDEATAFQDVSFHISLPSAKAGQFAIFGIGGKSSTVFNSPGDTADITEEKQLFDIDFRSKMGAVGLTHVLPVGEKSVWRSVVAASALQHRRTADLVENPASKIRWEEDDFTERKISLSSVFTHKISARHRLKTGVQASREFARMGSYFTENHGVRIFGGEVAGWLMQPFLSWHTHLSPRLEMTAGLQLSHFTFHSKNTVAEPRLALSFSPQGGKRLSLAYSLLSQTQLPQVYLAPSLPERGLGFLQSHHVVAGYRQELSKSLIFNAETYFQYLFDVPAFGSQGSTFSVLNLTDFSVIYLEPVFGASPDRLMSTGKGRNYGLDLSLQKFILDRYYFLLAASLYRSEYTTGNGVWRSTRFDGGHLLNLTGGREFVKNKTGKTITKGVNTRIAWIGGYQDTPIDEVASEERGFTVYREAEAFTLKLEDYFRVDMRLYLKWNKTGRNSTLSLDIQNVTSRKNVQYNFFDSVKGQVVTKRQLGMIPILSWRVEF